MIIVLLGYMASGKSFIGRQLAEKLAYDFIDLDDVIQVKENQSITDVFNNKGEIYFRKLEAKSLETLLSEKENTVLALGGGTPCYGNSMALLLESQNCKTFYLKISLPLLVERLNKEKEKRPLIAHLKNKEELLEFVGKHLFERNYYYNQSEYIINTDKMSLESIIEAIIFKLF